MTAGRRGSPADRSSAARLATVRTAVLLAGISVALPPPAQLHAQAPDSTTYATPETQALVARATERHHAQDTTVADYRASIRYRLSFSLGRRRWGNIPTAAVEEQQGTVAWQRPNDLRVDIAGRRQRSRWDDVRMNSTFDQPWFVPRQLGDSVRIFGNDFPEQAAIHPLASDGPAWYRYAMGDQVTISTPRGRRLTIVAVSVTPKRPGPALVVGRLWLDAETAEVVRFSFRYVGNGLWDVPDGPTPEDSARARRANRLINRIVSIDADLEYALQDDTYWMPYRQVLSGRVQVPLISDIVLPFEAITTFDDYVINTGRSIVFHLPPPPDRRSTRAERQAVRDSLRAIRRGRLALPDSLRSWDRNGRLANGGRFEIHRAPRDSLDRYDQWGDSLQLDIAPEDGRRIREVQEDLARMVEGLSGSITGQPSHGIAYERFADVLRYNRVQGLSLGFGYRTRIIPVSFTSLFLTGRFGLSDLRPNVRASVIRDAPSGRLALSAYRDLIDVDPFASGSSLGNSVRALISGRDEADYYLAAGGSIAYTRSVSRGVDLTVSGLLERQDSVIAEAHNGLNDLFGGSGVFSLNPGITEGLFGGGSLSLEGVGFRTRWRLTGDVLAGAGRSTARLHGSVRLPIGGNNGMTLRAHGGVATRSLLPQMAFRAGGLGSVRGFDYGTQRGRAFWAVQTDWALNRKLIRPVLFLDAGQAGTPARLGNTKLLVGGGAGLSFFRGIFRLDLSHPITPDRGEGVRLDLVFGAPR